jgi:hypothetical protein
MQLTIKLPDILPDKKTTQLIKKIENLFVKEGISYEIKKELPDQDDTWDSLDIESIAVDTGIKDFAKNHDHYLYGTPKIL